MKFGIFIFGDNHPELGRSNQKYAEEVRTVAEWAEELGFDSFWLGEHHLLLVRHVCVAADADRRARPAHKKDPLGSGGRGAFLS